MTKITFACDRCKTVIEGVHTPEMTGGFYVVSGDAYWSRLRRDEHEHFVCDTCIQSMPEYQAIYGY